MNEEIDNTINILLEMKSACPVECLTSMRLSLHDNLILVWRWEFDGDVKMYSHELSEISGGLEFAINKARQKIRDDFNDDKYYGRTL